VFSGFAFLLSFYCQFVVGSLHIWDEDKAKLNWDHVIFQMGMKDFSETKER
jgi:hypothetical protein